MSRFGAGLAESAELDQILGRRSTSAEAFEPHEGSAMTMLVLSILLTAAAQTIAGAAWPAGCSNCHLLDELSPADCDLLRVVNEVQRHASWHVRTTSGPCGSEHSCF